MPRFLSALAKLIHTKHPKPADPKYEFTSLWIQDELPDYVRMCINSFLRHGHAYTLFTYGNVKIPEVNVRDAREILPKNDIFRDYATGSFAPFSDWFRWKWLHEEGGIWIDADVCCLSDRPPFLPWQNDDQEYYLCYEDAKEHFISASCMKLPPKSLLAYYMEQLSREPLTHFPWERNVDYAAKENYYAPYVATEDRKKRQERMPWAYSSTLGLTAAANYCLSRSGAAVQIAPYNTMFPIGWKDAIKLYDGSIRLDGIDLTKTWAIHLWGHEMYKNSYNIHTPQPSLMLDLLEKYGM